MTETCKTLEIFSIRKYSLVSDGYKSIPYEEKVWARLNNVSETLWRQLIREGKEIGLKTERFRWRNSNFVLEREMIWLLPEDIEILEYKLQTILSEIDKGFVVQVEALKTQMVSQYNMFEWEVFMRLV